MNFLKAKRPFLILVFCIFISNVSGQTFSILTWNIQDLGRTKDEAEIAVMVDVMKDFDLILVQEVVAKDPAGARKVAQIADELNRKGTKWDYRVSNPTQSPSSHISERYAFLWKTATLQLVGRPFLDDSLAEECYREPYIAEFRPWHSPETFFVINFHSRRFDENPEEEIKFFNQYPRRLGTDHIFIAGDFNLDETHAVWDDLEKKNFSPAIINSPTTLKRKCSLVSASYLNHPIDNIFFHITHYKKVDAGRMDFVTDCKYLEKARGVSDHLPVFLKIDRLSLDD